MSWIEKLPPEVVDLAVKVARGIAKALGRDGDLAAIERIKDGMLEGAFAAGVELGLALGDLEHGAQGVVDAMRAAEKSPTVPRIDPEHFEVETPAGGTRKPDGGG